MNDQLPPPRRPRPVILAPTLRVAPDEAEWDLVARFTTAFAIDETDRIGGGVRLWVTGHERVWATGPPWLAARIDGTRPPPAELDGATSATAWLPTRLVVFAATLAAADGACELWVQGTRARVASASGSADFEVRGFVPELDPPRQLAPAATARLRGDRLAHLAHLTRRPPYGVELGGSSGPLSWLRIGGGAVEVAIDWGSYGACSSAFRVAAETQGEARLALAPYHLAAVVDAIDPAEELVLHAAPGQPLVVTGDGWLAAVATTDAWNEVRWTELDGVLDELPWPVRDESATERLVDVDGVEVAVALDEGSPPRLTLTTVLAEDLPGSPALLAELNELTRGLTGMRVWWDDGVVFAETDLRYDRVRDLYSSLRDLAARTTDLGLLLSAVPGDDP